MLHIHMAEVCVEGHYWCETLVYGEIQSFSILLKKIELPNTLRITNSDSKQMSYGTESIALDLICTVISGIPKETLSWMFNGEVLVSDNSTDSLKYTIIPDRTFDYRVYTCQADSRYLKTPLIRNITLNIDYPPDVFAIDYNNGTLFCNATGNPGIHNYSQWEHRSSNNKHIRYLDGRQNGYLLIPNLNGLPWFCKSGTYICSAENGITNNHRLYSTGSIHVEFEGTPECILNDFYGYGVLGLNAEISIEVYCVPKYDAFHWKTSDVNITNSSTKYFIKVAETHLETVRNYMHIHVARWKFSLIIYDLNQDDFEYYTLQVRNQNGNTFCGFRLKHTSK
ncbi:Hypothetical predicted protein [Mytilus galloprovincialis]|uniref:Ig-like domain-containing protein n=1 Tax=Mytilus galloprovincialis TaxID=29158 RepID=A0A8B6DDE9_MYTGA|nr:Hypothetical predicted protein [Mytilus galloprovincialis]